MNAKLQKAIDQFLAERREGDGGYAPVTNEDVASLHRILSLLVEAKFEADPDGDRPIDWNIIDRTKYWPMHFTQVGYSHKAKTDEDWQRIMDANLINLSIALEDMRQTTALMRDRNRNKKNASKKD